MVYVLVLKPSKGHCLELESDKICSLVRIHLFSFTLTDHGSRVQSSLKKVDHWALRSEKVTILWMILDALKSILRLILIYPERFLVTFR